MPSKNRHHTFCCTEVFWTEIFCELMGLTFHLLSIIYIELKVGLTNFQSSQDCCISFQKFSVFSFSETERLRLKFIRIQLASDQLYKCFQISRAQEKQCHASNTLLLHVLSFLVLVIISLKSLELSAGCYRFSFTCTL